MMKICLQCKNQYNGRSHSKFCSQKCVSQSQSKKVLRACEFCKNQFTAKQDTIKKGKSKFCSRNCHFKSKSAEGNVIVNCQACGKDFKCWKNDAENRKYCSRKCMSEIVWKDGKCKCRICGIEKDLPEFSKNRKSLSGYDSRCKKCAVDRTQKRYFLKTFGLTREEIEEMAAGQNYLCLICQQQKLLCVDHCHITGKIRGLLCKTCNSAIGLLKDDSDNLLRAINYLENNKAITDFDNPDLFP